MGQPVQRVFKLRLVASAIRHCQVSGGDDGRLWRVCQRLAQTMQYRFDLVYGKRKTAPQVERCGGVIDA